MRPYASAVLCRIGGSMSGIIARSAPDSPPECVLRCLGKGQLCVPWKNIWV